MSISNKKFRINEEIVSKEVRVVDEFGKQLGLVKLEEALKTAKLKGYDLVEIAPMAVPPVCKIVDYGKFKFEQTKKEKEAKKNQKTTEVKEIRLSLNIDSHDFNTKAKNALKFLDAGNKVKVTVRFKGRELAHQTLGNELLERFKFVCEKNSYAEKPSKMEGKSLVTVLSPKSEDQMKNNKTKEN